MRRRSFPSRTGIWRQRFVQIARELDAGAGATPAGTSGLRPRAGAMAAARPHLQALARAAI